jgi:uncharacterized membrane protein YjjP (DUF1212 family)
LTSDASHRPLEIALLLELGRALHIHGAPARRLETTLHQVAAGLDLQMQIFVTTTVMIVSFGPETNLATAVVRFEPREFDLGKLARLDGLVTGFLRGAMDKQGLHDALTRIRDEVTPSRSWITLTTRTLGAASWVFLLGGGPREALAASLAALLMTLWMIVSHDKSWMSHEFSALAAMICGATVIGCATLFGPLSPQVTNLAALVPLLPGLQLVIATEEIASKDLMSGTSRLMGGAMVFIQLVFGVALGSQLARLVDEELVGHPHRAMSLALQCVVLLPALGALAVQFRVAARDLPWAFVAGFVGFLSSRAGTAVLGLELGAFVGSLAVGAFGNAIARWLHRPALLTIIPGMYMLLPGTLGFESVSALWSQEPLQGIRGAFSVAVIAVALTTGLLVSTSALPPRRSL